MEKKKEIKLSCCMILKNEEETIYGCLNSLKDFVDEFIIGIDENSDDNTEAEVTRFALDNKLAEEYIDETDNARVTKYYKNFTKYYFKWQDDFSKARNEGMDKATGDYILIMDGHEHFPIEWFNVPEEKSVNSIDCMKKSKSIIAERMPDEVHIQLFQQPFLGLIPNNFFLQPRIYRNGYFREYEKKVENGMINVNVHKYKEDKTRKIRFGRPAHNTIRNTDQDNTMHLVEVIILHNAPTTNRAPRQEQRLTMNPEALSNDIKNNPKDSRAMFYLGNTLLEAKKYRQSMKWFDKYLKVRKDDQSEKYQVLLHKSICLQQLDKAQDMKDTLYSAIAVDPLRRDAHLLLGDLFANNNRLQEALFEYTTCLNLKPRSSRMFQSGATSSFDPHQKLAFLYARMNQIPKALAHLSQAYKYFPNEKWAEQIATWKDGKANILIIDRLGSFTNDFEEHLKKRKGYNIIKLDHFDTRMAMWADRIWCEWGNEDAMMCSKSVGNKSVIRIHGWEAYANVYGLKQIEFNKLKGTVFVAKHIQDIVKKQCKIDNSIIIPNGVNTDKYYIKNKDRDQKNVGYAGLMNVKKNPFLLIKIIKSNPDYNFHLRITHQDPFWEATFRYELKDCKNVTYHGYYDNLNEFWNDMSIVLSTSIIESFSYNVAEGMACGCKPYIYNWNGAKDIYPEKFIFKCMPKFEKVNSEAREEYRRFIINNYPLDKSLIAMEKVLME
jgi:glycosyltransferase involved in cell wall biosynthesis